MFSSHSRRTLIAVQRSVRLVDVGGERRLPTGTAAVVLADMAGSTRLWEDHPVAMASVLPALERYVDEVAATLGGVRPAEQGEGDSFVVGFARASSALEFARQLQPRTREEAWPDDVRIRLRMAVHAGELDVRASDLYVGPVMNRAGRLRALAAGGQTLVSGAVHELVDGRAPHGASLEDRGTHQLRDLDRPERVFELVVDGASDEFPPLLGLDATPHNLPGQLTSFVGREDERRQLLGLIASQRLVTVTGPGGAGKTRLAVHVAADVPDVPDGVWFVDLGAIGDAPLVGQAIADATRGVEAPGRQGVDAAVHALGSHAALVVLDNCEHVIAAAAIAADRILRSCPRVKVLATSREPLGVDGEITWRIPTLSLPEDDTPGASPLLLSDAVRLFIDRALAVRPNFAVTNDNAPAVTKICQRLDGIPLAIELAAARVRVLSPEQIADGLDDRFGLLGAGPRTALPRQATLTASVDWSVDLLDDAERALLSRLSVFGGSFDLDAVEHVCSGTIVSRHRVLDLLDALVQKSLVVVEDLDGGTTVRYRLLETIREYAAARVAPDVRSALVRAHLRWYAEVAGRLARPAGATTADRIEQLDAELPNLRSALGHAVTAEEPDDVDVALRLAAALVPYWTARGLASEGSSWLEAILALEGGDLSARARAKWGEGELKAYAGDFTATITASAEARGMAKEAGDIATDLLAASVLASSMVFAVGPELAAPLMEEVRAGIALVDEPFVGAQARFYCGAGFVSMGRLEESIELLDASVELQRATGIGNDHAPLVLRSFARSLRGELEAARADAARAVDLGARSGTYWYAVAELALGMADALAGRHEDGLAALARARSIAAERGDLVAQVYVSGLGMVVDFVAGDRAGIDAAASSVNDAFRDIGQAHSAVNGLAAVAHAALLDGDLEAAREAADRLREARRTTSGAIDAFTRLVAPVVLRACGDLDEALEEAHRGLDAVLDQGALVGVPPMLDAIAGLWLDGGAAVEALRLLAAAEAARCRRGFGRWVMAEPQRQADVAAARAAVGVDAADAAWTDGAALDVDEAVAYVRRGRGKRGRPPSGWSSLTPAETEVVRLVADGLTNVRIAERLFVSTSTVRTHLRSVFGKLGVTSRTELAAIVVRRSTG